MDVTCSEGEEQSRAKVFPVDEAMDLVGAYNTPTKGEYESVPQHGAWMS